MMRPARKWIALLVTAVALVGGCSGGQQGGAQSMEQKAWAAIRDGALLIDVRTPREFQRGHLDGAINIVHTEIEKHAGEFGPKDRSIVVYCAVGSRSGRAKQKLEALGFTNVINGGGLRGLQNAKQ